MENWALSTVKNELHWKRMTQNYNFSLKTVLAVIIAMSCPVEKN